MKLQDLDPGKGIGLFTDGSSWCKDRSGGWAWLAIDAFDGEAHDSGSATDTTNNQMEMTAWIRGLNAVHLAFGPCDVVVYSDSEYVGLGAMERTRARKKNQDLWIELDAAIDQHEYVEFEHVRGHQGHYFNERVDQLAGQARKVNVETISH